VTEVEQSPVASASEWKAAKGHLVTLPSGKKVRFQIPNLAVLAKSGELPNSLLAVAVPGSVKEADVTTPEEAQERIARLADFQRWLIAQAVVEPEISEEDVDALPTEDVDCLVELATRGRDQDAVGHHISGLEESAEWRRFRGIPDSDASILDE
jgi:hypothetical protein